MSEERELRSPFDLTANLYAYVPREAMERCLSSMISSLRKGEVRIALTGPAGIGKTLLLHMLGDRIGHELGFVYLPYAALPPQDLCTWALGRMSISFEGDPVEALTATARDLGRAEKALLLLLDDASTMSLETARWLACLTEEFEGALRIVVASTDGPRVDPLLEALGPSRQRCRLDEPLSENEMREYVESRLALAHVPESIRSRFDEATLAALFRTSEGNPRQLHTLASAVIRGLPPGSVGLAPSEETASEPGKEKKKARSRKKRRGAGRKKRAEPLPEESPETPAAEPAEGRALAEARAESGGPSEETGPFVPLREPPPGDATEAQWTAASVRDRPAPVPLAPPTRIRVFRTGLIAAAGLVAMLLARPVVPLGPPPRKVLAPPSVVARIMTELPPLPPGVQMPQRAAQSVSSVLPHAPEARIGTFSVQVNATPWAKIEVDSVDFGVTPVADIPLLAGEHTFRARMADGRVLERVVEIDADRRFVFFE